MSFIKCLAEGITYTATQFETSREKVTKQGMSTVDLKLALENSGVTFYKRHDRTRDKDIQNVCRLCKRWDGKYAFVSDVVVKPGANGIDRQRDRSVGLCSGFNSISETGLAVSECDHMNSLKADTKTKTPQYLTNTRKSKHRYVQTCPKRFFNPTNQVVISFEEDPRSMQLKAPVFERISKEWRQIRLVIEPFEVGSEGFTSTYRLKTTLCREFMRRGRRK
ncbi:hypothetical protein BDD12DRAFT_980423 [Trichophaea hybrida]|nr:hypothetical protein BDD12DRAFT_980423 [Trichophaea hybrida]